MPKASSSLRVSAGGWPFSSLLHTAFPAFKASEAVRKAICPGAEGINYGVGRRVGDEIAISSLYFDGLATVSIGVAGKQASSTGKNRQACLQNPHKQSFYLNPHLLVHKAVIHTHLPSKSLLSAPVAQSRVCR